ncbi:hypothetical protein JCM8097_003968 [Rhodosporidiobolus ruineniae]
MLLALPPELVEHILRLALPEQTTRATYRTRQAMLRSCCLASSSLRAVAQPMLEAFVFFQIDKHRQQYVKHHQGEKLGIRVLQLEARQRNQPVLRLFSPFITRCHALRHLSVSGVPEIDLKCLEDLPNLHSLRLASATSWVAPCVLPRIVELSYQCNAADPRTAHAIVASSTFPSLRLLCSNVVPCDSVLLKQLDGFAYLPNMPIPVQSLIEHIPASRILVPIHSSTSALNQELDYPGSPRFLVSTATANFEPVRRLSARLEAKSGLDLPLLLLPTAYRPDKVMQHPYNIRLPLVRLVQTCNDSQIPIAYEDLFVEGAESYISPKFWRYAREVKAKEEAEKQG